jgi:hypothetical protein
LIRNAIGQNIGIIVLRCIEKKEQFKIVSRTFGGDYFVQTVGDKARYNKVRVFADLAEKYVLDDIEADAEVIEVDFNGETYKGVIRNPINWSIFHAGVSYYGEFDLLIREDE